MEVRHALDAAELREALGLRDRVFCGEQGVSADAERDGRDGDALHLVAVENGRVVGTCRLVFAPNSAFLGRLAVEPDRRRRGTGAALAFPTTAFYDARGKLTYVHQGAYATEARLREDIQRYAG